jgi:antitoxin ParD1/3/4
MDIILTAELEEIINQKIGSGQFNSASEVIGASLRLLNQWDQLRLEELKLEIAKGIDSLDRGEGTALDVEAIKAEGRLRLAERSGASNGTSHHLA